MFDKYDPGLLGGLIGALIAMALGKFVESIYIVHRCKKQVDSLDVLVQSIRPIFMRIEGENDNVWSQESRRARVLIQLEWKTILLEWRTVSTYNVKALRHISKRSTHIISDIYNKMQAAQLAAAGAAAERLAQLVVAEGTAERGREERERVWMQRLEDLDRIWMDQREKSTKVWLGWLDEAARVRQGRMEESERVWTERLEESARVWRGRLEELERVWMERRGRLEDLERVWMEKLGRLGELERVRMERLGRLEESERVWMQRVEESARISLERQQELEKIWMERLEAWNALPLSLPSPSSLEPRGVWDAPIPSLKCKLMPPSPMFKEDLERIPMDQEASMGQEAWDAFAFDFDRVATLSSPPPPPLGAWDVPPSPSPPPSPLEFASEEKNPLSTVEEDEMPLQTLPPLTFSFRHRGRGGSGGYRHGNQADTSAHSHLP